PRDGVARDDAADRRVERLLPRDRHAGRDLRGARARPEHRGRARGIARPRLRGVLRGRRLLVGDLRLAARERDLRRRLPARARLEDSQIGRVWEAIREDEVAAQAMGVRLVRAKLLAFACGASFAGVMGVVFAAKQVFINPESFTFLESIGVLAMVILGGMGSIPGAVLGATVVTVLNLQVLKGFSLWLNELKNAGVV